MNSIFFSIFQLEFLNNYTLDFLLEGFKWKNFTSWKNKVENFRDFFPALHFRYFENASNYKYFWHFLDVRSHTFKVNFNMTSCFELSIWFFQLLAENLDFNSLILFHGVVLSETTNAKNNQHSWHTLDWNNEYFSAPLFHFSIKVSVEGISVNWKRSTWRRLFIFGRHENWFLH